MSKELTDAELSAIKADTLNDMIIARHRLLNSFPFIGNISMRMDLVPVRDLRCRTACTDGNTIYMDVDFSSQLSFEERQFVIAHEIFHCVLLHLVRLQTRDPELFNIATDMEVNYMLSQQNTSSPMSAPKNLCFPPQNLEGKSAEEIYEWLLKEQKKNKSKSSDGIGFDGGSNAENKKGKSALSGQFDKHQYSNSDDQNSDNDDQDGGFEVTDKWGKVGLDKDFKPRVKKDFADRMREAVVAEAQRCERMQGHLPAGLDGILGKILKPEISWQEELTKFVTRCFGDRRQWLPPHRRGVWNEMYMQSRRGEKLKCCVVVDTSGSCWGDLSKFFTEINSLLKTFGNYEMTVVQCDAEVHRCDKYDDSHPFPIDNLKAIDINGNGGSDFRPVMPYIRKNGIEYDVIIFFTDGYIDMPMYAPPKPALIILTKDGNKQCCAWGKKLIFKNNSYD